MSESKVESEASFILADHFGSKAERKRHIATF
jgi:tRNA pseudouridine-54 N-methylase